MSDTAGKPNGGVAQRLPSLIEIQTYSTGDRDFPGQRQVSGTEVHARDYIDPRELYRVYSPEKQDFTADASIARISHSVAECLPHLVKAISETDELQRENHAALAFAEVFRLARFTGMYMNLDDALALILGALAAHRSTPYSRGELVMLRGALEKLRRNPIPTEGDLSLLYTSLADAGFDLNAPFKGLDLSLEDEG